MALFDSHMELFQLNHFIFNFHVFILHLFNKENNVGYSKLSADHYSVSLFSQGEARPVQAVRVYFVIMTSIIYWLWSII